MTDNLIEENNGAQLTDKEIFTEIWSSPRKILSFINRTGYEKYFYLLWFFAGVARALDRAIDKDYDNSASITGSILISVLIGGLLGWISYYIYAALVSWTGRWLKGNGNTKSLFRIFAYANIPAILIVAMFTVQILIYGEEIFKIDGDLTSAGTIPNIIFYSLLFFEIALSIYTLVFMVIGISVVQKLSYGKAFLNLILPVIIIAIPILIILMISGIV